MRVLMTTDTLGGVWTYSRELTEGLLEEGCSVALVSLGRIPNASQLSWVDAQAFQWGARFRFAGCAAPLEWMQGNEGAMSEAEPLLRRVAEDFKPDLLLSSQFCFGALKLDMPRVVVAHSDVLSWARACRATPLPETAWLARYRSLVQTGLREADTVIAPTQWMLDALTESFTVPGRTHVIANGRAIRPAGGQGHRRVQAVSAGRLWDAAKNLRLLSELKSAIPILLAGEMEHEGIRSSGARGSAVMLGALEEEQLLLLFQQSSVYICASIYEPFGLAPLEAALCGCAVLANDIPSLREVWGGAAIYFKDAEALSAALRTLANDPVLLEKARNRAGERAAQLTAKRMTEKYLDVLHGVLQAALVEHYAA